MIITIRSTTSKVADIFLHDCIILYGKQSYILKGNGTELTNKFVDRPNTDICAKHLIATAYHPQANGQVQRYNNAILMRLLHYVANIQRECDAFSTPQITKAHKTQCHGYTVTTNFSLFSYRNRPESATLDNDSTFSS